MAQQFKTILYVDDDPDDRELLTEVIRNINPQVRIIEAENGAEALTCLKDIYERNELLPCLIILDLNMPVLDGRETFKRIKSDPVLKEVPLVVFTSSLNPNDKINFQKQGIELISKPDNFTFFGQIATQMLVMCNRF